MYNLNESIKEKQELIDLMEKNGSEWIAAFAGLMRAADGATPEQIAEVIKDMEEWKAADTETRIRALIGVATGHNTAINNTTE